MLKQDARVVLVAASLPIVACLPAGQQATAGGPEAWPPSSSPASGSEGGGWRAASTVSGLLAGAPLEVQARASALRINGVALQWRAVSAQRSPAQVAAALGVAWRAAGQEGVGQVGAGQVGAGQVGDAQAAAAPWMVLTRRVGNELHALQLRDDGHSGCEGYWSVLDPTQPAGSRPRAPIAIPAGAGIDSTIEQLDPAIRSTQYLGRARLSAATLGPRLRRAALAAGWQEQSPAAGVAGFQAYARADERLELQVMPDGGAARFLLNVHGAAQVAPPGSAR